jgi:hypothetical protein
MGRYACWETLTGSDDFSPKPGDLVLILLTDFSVLCFKIIERLTNAVEFVDL